jgi:hypothetical protein
LFEEAGLDWELGILVCGVAAEVVLILMLIKGQVYRTFPAFFAYLCWSLISDSATQYVRVAYPQNFFQIYIVQLTLDSVMIFALLVEVAWSVLRPIRNSLPKNSWIGIAVLVLVGGAMLWPLAGLAAPGDISPTGKQFFMMQQTPAILRAVFFLALAGFSQVLSIGWRDRELQIVTGLGFFSIVSLAVTILHTHQTSGTPIYHWLDRAVAISYLSALLYWCVAFATQPAERREFTPQMKSMLLAVAGAARSARIDLEDSTKPR